MGRPIAGFAILLAFALAACGGGAEEVPEPEETTEAPVDAEPTYDVDVATISQGEQVLDAQGLRDDDLIARGEELWNDPSLSSGGQTCASCHVDNYGMMQATFAEPYPHYVKMAQHRAGMEQATAAEMVQLCMVIPMQSEPLDYASLELAALTRYVEHIQEGFAAAAGE